MRFNVVGGSHANTQKMLYIPILFGPEMHKTLQIPVFLKAKQKNTVNYSIFGGLIATNLVFTMFLQFQENVEGAKHCK